MSNQNDTRTLPTDAKDLAFWKQADAPAHPLNFLPGASVWERVGLTKREYFAAKALQGRLASGMWQSVPGVVKDAVVFADLLLKELAK